jgi:MFS family permease
VSEGSVAGGELRAGFGNAARTLGIRNYRVFTIGNGISQTGYWIQRVAIGWLAWQLTYSGTWLGLVAAADLVPAVLLSPFAGALADRVDRLLVNKVSQYVAMTVACALAGLSFADIITIGELFSLTFALGIVNALNQPARLALIPSLVDHASLPSAVAINSLVFNSARFVGPAIAGVVIAEGNVALAFVLNALAYVAFSLALVRIRVPPERLAPQHHFLRQSIDGFVYSVRHPGIGQMMILFAITSVGIRGYIELFPGFADSVFHQGAQGLAWLSATVGLGAMAGSVLMMRRSGLAGLTAIAIGQTLLMTLSVFAFAATSAYWFALACVFVGGFAMVISGIAAQTLVQTAVDPVMRGRVMAFYGMVFRAGPALGALIFGWLASLFGFRAPVAAGALACVLVWVWARLRQDAMARALEGEAAPAHAPSPAVAE